MAEKSGFQVLSFDLPEHGERAGQEEPCTIQNGVRNLNEVSAFAKDKYSSISLYTCSLVAYFSLMAYAEIKFVKCLFLSPLFDREQLIRNRLQWANLSEEELKEKEEYKTSFGETLSWKYYEYVRNNSVKKWNSPTWILYGENDNLTERSVLDSFTIQDQCVTEIMPHGEYYFHTDEQLEYV